MSLNQKQPKPLELAFIGGSIVSAVGYTHGVASQMDHRWRLAAGCFSTRPEVNAETAARWGVSPERLYPDWKTLLEDERGKADAVVILTPTPCHAEMVESALRAGYPVICEKALACNRQEIERIEHVLEETHGFLAVTYNYSGYPMLRELRHKIFAGELGEILHVQIEMPQEGFIRLTASGDRPCPQSWRLKDGDIPTIYLDLAVHLHHLNQYLTDKQPAKVVADQDSHGWFDGVVDNVSCLLRYEDGMQCQMWYSKSALGYRNGLRVRVFGRQASAEWLQTSPEELLLNHADGRREILDRAGDVSYASQRRYERFKAGHPAGFIEAFANLYEDLADAVIDFKEGRPVSSPHVFGVQHAAEGIRLLDAVVASAKQEKWIYLKPKGSTKQ
ncbi:Gfo/Idh/MocA family oxidoreductase [Marinobacter halodurans]|uniref:Gfo/Idh/MocA family oxidoreductase n=1 Tax=Marinobacter halodurans TaxID=2528979 RepID=A0ABY1ZQ70_9GAMM|nr:Gfo/Idh/MocA family oxidoreductase [Marinobacter halodurans]TBW56652.1 Gfo/Idh/MocA family oxidoreductase [Marinobacter halodurans]